MPAAAIAVPAALSAGASIFGGITGASAAKKAAQTQYDEAVRQAQGFRDTLNQYNPPIMTQAERARSDALDAATAAGSHLTDTAEAAAQGVTGAATSANQLLQPYMDLGTQSAQTLSQMMQPGGDLNRNFTFQDMQAMDPGYQFRIDQANQALARSAAARGGALGGGALRAADQLTQNLASSEYGAAFDRFRTQANDRFSRFSNLMDMGTRTAGMAGQNLMTAAQQSGMFRTNAANTVGNWGINASEFGSNAMMNAAQQQAANALNTQKSIADYMTGGAAAQGAGQVGAANAWSGAFSGVANAAGQAANAWRQQEMMDQMQNGGYGNNPNFMYYNNAPNTFTPPQSTYMPTPNYAYNNPSLNSWINNLPPSGSYYYPPGALNTPPFNPYGGPK